MKAYKAFNVDNDGNLTCRNFVYEEGKTYIMPEDDIEICKKGFHACEDLYDCIIFYPYCKNKIEYHEVECSGKIIKSEEKDDTKFVCSTITIGKRVQFPFEEKNDFDTGFASDGIMYFLKSNKTFAYKKDWTKLFDNGEEYYAFFKNGFAVVYRGENNNRLTYIDINGNRITDKLFFSCSDFKENGYAVVVKKTKNTHLLASNVIKTNGELVSDIWFTNVLLIENYDYAFCCIGKKTSVLNLKTGKIVDDMWFDDCLVAGIHPNKKDLIFIAKESYGECYMKQDGDYLVDMSFEKCGSFDETGHALAFSNDKVYKVNMDGEYEIIVNSKLT